MRPQQQVGLSRDARSLALGAIAVYLAVSGVLLAMSGHGWLVALHAAGIELARRTIAPKSRVATTIGDLFPLIAAPALYAEIPMLIAAVGGTYHDALVQHWELALFGAQPSRSLAGALPFAGLSELLHAGYLAYYPAVFVPPLVLFARRDRFAFSQTVFAITCACLVCWALFVLFPVEGPRYLWVPDGVPSGPVRRFALWILASGSARGAAFPSSHMAVSIVQMLLAWRWQRRMAWVLAAVVLLVGLGAVYGGFHYATDMFAGAALGVLIVAIVRNWTGNAPLCRE